MPLVYLDRANGLAVGMSWEEIKANALEMERNQKGVDVEIDGVELLIIPFSGMRIRYREHRAFDQNLTLPVALLRLDRKTIPVGDADNWEEKRVVVRASWHFSHHRALSGDEIFATSVRDFQRITRQEGKLTVHNTKGGRKRVWMARQGNMTYAVYEYRPRDRTGVIASIHDSRWGVPLHLKEILAAPTEPSQ